MDRSICPLMSLVSPWLLIAEAQLVDFRDCTQDISMNCKGKVIISTGISIRHRASCVQSISYIPSTSITWSVYASKPNIIPQNLT
jgi:hypothetical protein